MVALEEAEEEADDAMDEDKEGALEDMPLALQELQPAGGVPARLQTLRSAGV